MFASFDYFLFERLKIKMKGLIQIKEDTPLGASFIKGSGVIALRQQYPILTDSIRRELHYKDPLTDNNFEQFDTESMIENYNERSEILEY